MSRRPVPISAFDEKFEEKRMQTNNINHMIAIMLPKTNKFL